MVTDIYIYIFVGVCMYITNKIKSKSDLRSFKQGPIIVNR